MIGDEIEASYRDRILSSRKGEASFFKLCDLWLVFGNSCSREIRHGDIPWRKQIHGLLRKVGPKNGSLVPSFFSHSVLMGLRRI